MTLEVCIVLEKQFSRQKIYKMYKYLTGIVQGKILERVKRKQELNLKNRVELEIELWFSYAMCFIFLI